jgi:tetratricopeptide (TPR) repeat protein
MTGVVVFLLAGCGSAHQSATPDDSFFTPLKELPRPAEPRSQTTAPPEARPSQPGRADSLLTSQRDQDRRIGALAVLLEQLETARRGVRSDSARVSPQTTKPVVAPKPVVPLPESQTILEAEKLYALQEYRRTIQVCQDVLSRGADKGIEDRYNFLAGASHFRLRQFDLALVSLKKVLEVKGSHKRADASFIMGLTYKQLGMRQRAASMFEAALNEKPDDELAASVRRELDRLSKNR